MPKGGPDFLLDVAKIQRRMNARAQQPMRFKIGVFRMPLNASTAAAERFAHDQIGTWINREAKEGWELKSDVRITGPYKAHDAEGTAELPGIGEYRVRAMFKMTRSVNPLRIELNPATVKQDPEHRLTLKEAGRAWGVMAPQALKGR